MKKLFNDNSDSDGETTVLKTNKEYERVYNSFREKELKQKLKDRGMNAQISDSDDSDTSSDDNDGEDPEFDEEFFKTLASLKSKDPKIYEKDTKFFQAATAKELGAGKIKKQKILTVKDLERKVILENEGKFVDDEEAEQGPSGGRAASPSLVEKEMAIKRQLASVMNADSDEGEDGDGWGGLFQKRNKSNDEEVQEEKQYAQWLSGQEKNIKKEDQVILKDLKSYWSNPKLSRDDKFLRDYILKSKHKEHSSKGIPTRDEILADGFEVTDDAQLSEDERDVEQQEEFEKKYNFRFEEPDQDFIKSYPRTIDWSVRADDDRRKQKRAEVKDRKVREKEQHRQELEMLKEIKRKEIQDKIDKLKRVTGAEKLPISDDFLNEDFDPDEHDRKMQEMFNDEYYGVDEGEEKPECPDDIEDLKVEDYDNFDAEELQGDGKAEGGDDEDDGEVAGPSAADRKKEFQEEVLESSRGRRRKRQSKFVQMLRKEKPVFDPEDEKTYGEYIDEYYKMDYEDLIGDVKCRFKYVETVPNDFGLTTAEILLAKSKELNQWAGIKKAVQIRPPHIEQNEARLYQAKGRNINLKKKILKSLFQEDPESDQDMAEETSADDNQDKEKDKVSVTKDKSDVVKKENSKKNAIDKEESQPEPTKENDEGSSVNNNSKKKRNRNRKKKGGGVSVAPAADKSVPKAAAPNPIKPPAVKSGGVEKAKNKVKPSFDKKSHPKKFHKNIKELDKKDATHISENRLKALGINPKKYQSKLIYGNKE